MKSLLCIVLLLPALAMAQKKSTATTSNKGIHFEHNVTWSDIQRKAKAENKYIFMDCFTTWCGPCKYMSKNIFPLEAVGTALNEKFINVSMQLDTSDADNAEVKKMYATAHAIARNYNVNVYPTFLFFNPDGYLVHRAVGSSEADAFLQKTSEALNSETQYYTLLARYKKGWRDSSFLHRLSNASLDAYDTENSSNIANDYLATQPNLYTPENLSLLKEVTQKSSDKGFGLMLTNAAKIDSVLGKGTADAVIQNIVISEELYPVMRSQNAKTANDLTEPDWADYDKNLNTRYPANAASLSAYSKVVFYMNKGDWDKFGPAVVNYMKLYGDNAGEERLNNFAWTVFSNCNDEACLQNALSWSKRSFEKTNNPMFMDTYANILYRLGKKDDALLWEEKAKNLVSENEKAGFQQTIEKMKRGDKTWN